MPGVPETPGFNRPKPDPVPAPDLPTLNTSLAATLNDGKVHRYPTLSDYVDYFVRLGRVKDLDDLVQNHSNFLNEIFFQWMTTGQLGCLFAVKLAKRPRENRWLPIVQLNAIAEGAALGGNLNSLLDEASESHEAALVIFPDIETEDQIVSLTNNLCGDSSGRWYWTSDGINPDPTGKHELVGLRWVLKGGTHVNFVLGFANIPTMALTRRSPFPALFLRLRENKLTEIKKEDGRVQVHLADLDSTFVPQERHDYVSELTKKTRANQVEQHMDATAKARVAFSVSREAARSLCAPRSVTIEKE